MSFSPQTTTVEAEIRYQSFRRSQIVSTTSFFTATKCPRNPTTPTVRDSKTLLHTLVESHPSLSLSGGHDIKSIAILMASIVLLISPIVTYWSYTNQASSGLDDGLPRYYYTLGAPVILLLVAYMVPPIGWRRPHPYSDDPTNVPVTWGKKRQA